MISRGFKGHLWFFRLQKKHTLEEVVRTPQETEFSDEFWLAFNDTEFDIDENEKSTNNSEPERDVIVSEETKRRKMDDQDENNETDEAQETLALESDNEEVQSFNVVSRNERGEGEHVGYDGESDRSEDEEMNDYDREFLNDESDEERPGTSHLALLNARRYDDDANILNR